jgi:hypothetical protein
MKAFKLVAVFSENKLGQLTRTTEVLARAGVNIRWIAIATSDSFGVIKFLADQCDLACEQLKLHGFTVSLIEVLAIEVQDKPGGLHLVSKCLSDNNINVQNSSGFVANGRAVLLIEVKDIAQARSVLEKQGMRLLSQDEMLAL